MAVTELPNTFARVKTPTIIQIEAAECGAVSLAIVMAYYGKYVPLEELRVSCSVSRDGSHAGNIVEAAKSFGMEAEGFSCDLEDLYEVKLPAILYWNFEHFVVLEGFSKERVFINDPASGPRSITYEELDRSFTGIALTLKPGPEFKRSGQPFKFTEAAFQRLRTVKGPLIFLLITSLSLIIPGLAVPAITQIFIDQVLTNHQLSWQNGLVIAMIWTLVAMGTLSFFNSYILNRLNIRLSIRYGSELLWRMFRLKYSFYTQRYPGEIASRLYLVDTISQGLVEQVVSLTLSCLMIVFYGFAMFYYDAIIASVAVVSVVLNFLLMRRIFRERADAYARYLADIGKSSAYSLGALKNIETIKATGTEYKFYTWWAGYFTRVQNTLQTIAKKNIVLGVVPGLLQAATSAAIIGIGGWRIITGHLTIGMFLALQILMRNFITPVQGVLNFSNNLQMFKADLARLADIENNPIDPMFEKSENIQDDPFTKLEGYVELRNVTFGYSPRDTPVLSDLFLSLSPGKSVALVGPTGCGKSTVAALIGGLYEPTGGEILFDGKPRDQISRKKLTHSLSLIEQDPFLFHGTAKENLTLLDSLVTQEQLVQAAKDACIHDDILARKGGYDLVIKENGSNLSGGQRQRFEIARGLVPNPSIIVLDEATSALDSETEAKVIQNILRRGCAILMIAHRLSTIINCDEIVVLENGHIVAVGTHEELKAVPGIYQNLIESEHFYD